MGRVEDAKRWERLGWLDAIRGFTIVTIPIFHAALLLQNYGYQTGSIVWLGLQYQTAGMALFFAVSGMNATRFIEADWTTCWRGRLAPMLWMMLIWATIQWLAFRAFPNPRHPEFGTRWWEVPISLIVPTSFTWFLWSLAAYLVLARLVRTVPRRLVIAVAGVVTLIMLGASDWHLRRYGLRFLSGNYPAVAALTYFLFFYLGYRYRDAILDIARWPLLPSLLGFRGMAFLLVYLASHISFFPAAGAVRLIAACVGLIGTIFFGRILLFWEPLRRITLGLGRMTLPIYLAHVPILVVLLWLIRHSISIGSIAASIGITISAGLVSTLLAVIFAVSVRPLRLTWLFKPPFMAGNASSQPQLGTS